MVLFVVILNAGNVRGFISNVPVLLCLRLPGMKYCSETIVFVRCYKDFLGAPVQCRPAASKQSCCIASVAYLCWYQPSPGWLHFPY